MIFEFHDHLAYYYNTQRQFYYITAEQQTASVAQRMCSVERGITYLG